MDPNELIKAAPEVGKIAGAIGFTDGVRRMLGPAADEVGEMLRDRVRLYRYERQIKLLDKFDRITQEAGFTPQAVPPKILFPLLEGASFEDNEDLHTMWASLLANAASPENATKVRPAFLDILKVMSPDEAWLLRWICEQDKPANQPLDIAWISEAFETLVGHTVPVDLPQLHLCLNLLQSRLLINTAQDLYFATFLGIAFLEAVRPPTPKN